MLDAFNLDSDQVAFLLLMAAFVLALIVGAALDRLVDSAWWWLHSGPDSFETPAMHREQTGQVR